MNLKDILHLTMFWSRWAKKLNKPILTDEDLDGIEKDIEEQLHINEPAIYKLKRNMKKKKGGKKC